MTDVFPVLSAAVNDSMGGILHAMTVGTHIPEI
jgi:hypothetical protein